MRRRTADRTRRGQAMVESALVLPVLFVLIFGCIDFSRYVYTRATLEADARAAARLLSLQSSRTGDCAVIARATQAGGGIVLAADPASVRGDGPSPVTAPQENQGLVYIYPAVAQSASVSPPGCQGAAGAVRPAGLVSVTITYELVPWTPLISMITGPMTITAQAQVATEY